MGISLVLVTALAVSIWHVINNQDQMVYRVIGIVLTALFLVVVALVAMGIAGMILTIVAARNIPSMKSSMRIATAVLFPIVNLIGTIAGIPRERIWGSFIAVNNHLVGLQTPNQKHARVMILAPHCLQNSECPHKVTMDVANCKRCGKCRVGDLALLSDQVGVSVKIATGGTLARKFIKETRPDAVVAIACERDLSLGIQDATPLPVLGVLNRRPKGPCQDTDVDMQLVENALAFLQNRTADQPITEPESKAVRLEPREYM